MQFLKNPLPRLLLGFPNSKWNIALLLCTLSSQSYAEPSSPQEWKDAAINDINQAYQIFLDNHPGVYDPQNPGFITQLLESKKRGLDYAARVDNANSYRSALLGFTAAIGDGHAGLFPTVPPEKRKPKWPGFFTAWRQQGLFVASSSISDIPEGAQVIACDGIPIKEVIENNVFSFEGRKNELGQWWTYAPHVFVDFNNPFVKPPKQCEFRHGEKTLKNNLQWQEITTNVYDVSGNAYIGDTKDVGISEPRPKLLWVAMPSFQPNEQQRAIYRGMYEELKSNRQRYESADAIVIDLRKNQGGSSEWSRDYAKVLWGATAISQRRQNLANLQVWWRASKDNTAYIQHELTNLLKEAQMESIKAFADIGKGMQSALQKGDKFYIETFDEQNIRIKNTITPLFTKPVYVIVHGYCASACADALDIFTLFENTKLVGAPSSGDSTYMDVRYQKMSSGLSKIIIPNKVYINRPRGNGQVYLPNIYANDLQWSSEKFLAIIENDLAKTGKSSSIMQP